MGVIFYYGKVFLIPLFFSTLLAMLLMPVCEKMENWGMNWIWSSLTGVLIIILFVAVIFGVIAAQGVSLSQDMPQMQAKASSFFKTHRNGFRVDMAFLNKSRWLTYRRE